MAVVKEYSIMKAIVIGATGAVGIAKNLAPMSVDTVARCMMEIGTENHGGVQIIAGQDIRDYMR